MMYYLCIDSTTKKLTVNLSRDGKMISGVSDGKDLKHMEKIMTHIDHVIRESRIDIGSIDVLGINTGPGDFTGTRIGISIIKTLSLSSSDNLLIKKHRTSGTLRTEFSLT